MANPLCQNKGRVWGQDLRCSTTPMDLWPTRHSPAHSPSVLIVFICRHKYEWNFSRHHPDSFLVPKCSLFRLYPIPGIQMSSPCKYFLALLGKQPANETRCDPRAHSPTWLLGPLVRGTQQPGEDWGGFGGHTEGPWEDRVQQNASPFHLQDRWMVWKAEYHPPKGVHILIPRTCEYALTG